MRFSKVIQKVFITNSRPHNFLVKVIDSMNLDNHTDIYMSHTIG